jgi:hypothetical protein
MDLPISPQSRNLGWAKYVSMKAMPGRPPGTTLLDRADISYLFSSLMYSHRAENHRVDVVDLDPYGTAAPFIDAAVQCVKDDGM